MSCNTRMAVDRNPTCHQGLRVGRSRASCFAVAWVVAGLVGTVQALAGPADALAAGRTKAKVKLLSSVEAVIPGQPFELGLRFEIIDKWHIYWQSSGDAGQPPSVKWLQVPTGFEIGELRFPVPKRHVEGGGAIVTNILEGEPTLLMTVTPSATIAGEKVQFRGKVSFLVCEKLCLPGSEELTIEIPVAPAGATVRPANEPVFTEAHRALPKTESRFLKVAPRLSSAEIKRGEPLELILNLQIAEGYKIQSNAPLQAEFYATDVFTQPAQGLIFRKPEFPAAAEREMTGLGKIAEFLGSIDVRVPIELTGEPLSCPTTLGGVVTFQACDKRGVCMPPDGLQFQLPIPCSQVHQAAAGIEPSGAQADGGAPTPPAAAQPPSPAGSADGQPEPPPSEATTAGGQPARSVSTSAVARPVSWSDRMRESAGGVLLLAFLGGLILNIMPCVLPVISIKVLSFVQQADEEPARVFRLGLTFALGILVSFWALALVIIALKAGGRQLGWGFQFQSPEFVIGMVAVVFLFGLSLFGVFQITLPGAAFNTLSVAEQREGYAGAFSKGLLGTVLATPCTAPFLGPALGVAFKSTDAMLLAIFSAIGTGMAAPFILLTINPRWLHWLPRPGAWMETFKQFMGFLLMGTVVWLLYPLGDLIGGFGLIWALAFLTFVALAAWVLGRVSPLSSSRTRGSLWILAVGLVVFGWWFCFNGPRALGTLMENESQRCKAAITRGRGEDCGQFAGSLPAAPWEHIPWQPWEKGLPEQLAGCGYTVYVDFTATWCATCLTNKRLFLETDSARSRMAELCVIPLKADFTRYDPDILGVLQSFGRSGVPLNVIYPTGHPDQPIMLPEFLGSTDYVVAQLDEAGKSTSACPAEPASIGAAEK